MQSLCIASQFDETLLLQMMFLTTPNSLVIKQANNRTSFSTSSIKKDTGKWIKLQIVKIGGNVIENRMALEEFLTDFSHLKEAKILVHGGGKEATQMAEKLGIPVQIIDGRRITDAANLEIISMLYAGKLNKNHSSTIASNGL